MGLWHFCHSGQGTFRWLLHTNDEAIDLLVNGYPGK
jgi:hypothetical protein